MKFNLLYALKSVAFTSAIVLTITSCNKNENQTVGKKNAIVAIDTNNFDKKASPKEDFYQYVNGSWMAKNPVPGDKSRWGAFDVMDRENNEKVKLLLEETSKKTDNPKGSTAQKMGDFYASAMDSTKIESLGASPIKSILAEIDGMKNIEDLQKIMAKYHSEGDAPFFAIGAEPDMKNSSMNILGIYQSGYGLPDRDYYLANDDRSKEIRVKYLEYMQKLFSFVGNNADQSKKLSDVAMKIETQFANSAFTRLEMRNPEIQYNKMDLSALEKLCPNVNWKNYFTAMNISKTDEINVQNLKFMKNLSSMMKSVSIEDWKTYLKWYVLNNSATALSSNFVDARFEFFGKFMTGAKVNRARWERMVGLTNNVLGEVVGQEYVKKYFPAEAKKKMLDLVNNLKASLKERLNTLDWMSAPTKAAALVKLETIMVKIGYPDKWKDYSALEIVRDDFYKNLQNASKFAFQDNIKKLGKPVDRTEWQMSPQTVNAYYNPTNNEIVFPAAILQAPFFNMDADDAVNYGGIGAVIGHEITHGFDDEGRKFDDKGNMKDWWAPEDTEKYKAKVQMIVDQYNKYSPLPNMNINGQLTLGENIADLGGVTISYYALQKANKGKKVEKIDGFTPEQRFFINYAQVWRQNIKDQELMKRIKEDPHSPAKFRVLGVVSNLQEFYDAFGLKQGDKLWKPVNERAKVW